MIRNVGLVGIGLLGQAIAERLLAEGRAVYGFDVREGLAPFVKAGGSRCDSLEEVAARSDKIILCLPDSTVVRSVVDELLPHLRSHTLIDTTTGAANATIEIGERLAQEGIAYLDATVAGSSEQMRSHEATLLIGGAARAFEECYEIFNALGQKMYHLGGVGSGSRMKLVVNLAIGLNRAVLAEALALGEAFGFDSHQVVDVLSSTPAHSAAMDTKGAKMADRDFAPQARLRQHHKDVKLILEAAVEHDANVPLSLLHENLLRKLVESGLGDEDNSVVINAFRK